MSNEMDPSLSRRQLLRGTIATASSLPLVLGSSVTAQEKNLTKPSGQSSNSDFSTRSLALEPDKIVTSACQFCNSLCGLKVKLKSGRVIGIDGFADDPVQSGQLCVKAEMMTQLVYNRHRLRTPLKRIGKKGDLLNRR
jgi:anaerobic selenocysteine-containing dehydrogenase